MSKREWLVILAILAASACGSRSELDDLGLSLNGGGLSSIGGTSSVGGSPSTGGTTNSGATICPMTAPQTGDICLTIGLFCTYSTSVCPLGYQCNASGAFEPVYVPCFANIGGTTSTAGTPVNGGTLSSTGGTTAVGGTTSTGGNQATGCSGSFEMILGNNGLCVAKMVPITGPASDAGSADYKIDATEVTKGQYDAWLATTPVLPASTDANCGYVTSYAEQGPGYTGPDADHHPVVYVDWCDAYVYCSEVDKRLCGAIGGGSVDSSRGYNDATRSQWYRTCTSGGTNAYPYGNGNTYQPTTCDGYDYWDSNRSSMQTVTVGSLSNCVTSVSGYAGVYDLSGNVWEWEDSCSGAGASASCRLRGGSFYGSNDLYCVSNGNGTRYGVNDDVGFRCCSQ